MIITASVSLQCPGTVGATSQDLKGFMSCTRRRTGSCDTASSDKDQGEAYQGKRGCIGQRDTEPSRDSNSGGATDRFRTEMSHGCRPFAHVGSGSQGAPCAGCRHADDEVLFLQRVGVLKSEGRGMTLSADPLNVR